MWVKAKEVCIVLNDSNIKLRALRLKALFVLGNKAPLWFLGPFENI
jgi:hypothetical protein